MSIRINKILSKVMCLFLSILATNCAVLNNSILETAEILEPGHIEVGVESGVGLEYLDIVDFESDSSNVLDLAQLGGSGYNGLSFGIGLNKELQLNMKLWSGISGLGGKIGFKQKISEIDSRYDWAIMPGVNFIRSEAESTEGLIKFNNKINAIGFEVPIIYSRDFSDFFNYSGGFRYSYDSINVLKSELFDIEGDYQFHRLGIYQCITISNKVFFMRPEIGIETVLNEQGDWGYMPTVNMRVGLSF